MSDVKEFYILLSLHFVVSLQHLWVTVSYGEMFQWQEGT